MVKIDINISPVAAQGASSKPKIHLSAPLILRYLIGEDEKVNDMVVLGVEGKDLVTTDKEMYEALGSVAKYDVFKPIRLAKLFEMVDVYPYRDLTHKQKPVLTFEKVEEIREAALKQDAAKSQNSDEAKKQKEQGQ